MNLYFDNFLIAVDWLYAFNMPRERKLCPLTLILAKLCQCLLFSYQLADHGLSISLSDMVTSRINLPPPLPKHLLLMLILLFQLHACETCLLKSPAPRKVTQYQYIEWPENGLPTTTSFVTFWRYVISMTEDNSAPLLVHCR